MKKLPLGQQNFEKIIKENYLYVDKTQHIFKLIESGTYYFLSRPRRFGKSLLISTLKELFSGNKKLFKGLWIEDKIDWKEHLVIHISFNTLDYKELGLRAVLNEKLDDIASEHGVVLKAKLYSSKFQELIRALAKKVNVVILIDEYDKPIIDYIDDLPKAEENREILKNFYSIVKDSDAYIRFFFITGVSKFSKVSVFSDLNNLNDITVHGGYSLLTGISHPELLANFQAHINETKKRLSKLYPNVLQSIKDEYLGYSWDGKIFVYNPFSILSFFDRYQFGDFWFQSGTPTFLIKLLKQDNYTAFDLENKKFMLSTFDKFEISDISLVILLFQTGYLTIKEFEHRRNIIKLGYPNNEVERAFSIHILSAMNSGKIAQTNSMLVEMTDALDEDRIDKFIELLKILFKGIAYPLIDDKEKYYHSIFYLAVKLIGFNIESEIMTIDGRIDCVMLTEKVIYVIEFKIGNTKKAIDQIREKKYHLKYASDNRPIKLLGIEFDTENKSIADYKLEDA